METLIDDVVSLFNNTYWDKIKQYPEILSVEGAVNSPNAHVRDITELFKDCNYSATYRNSDLFPIELSVVFKGVKFFSIHSLEDFTHVS